MQGQTSASIKCTSLAAVVTRKNGQVEDLGIISYWHYRPLCRWLFRLESRARAWRLALERQS